MKKLLLIILSASTLFLVTTNISFAASQFYGSPGTYYFTVPANATDFRVDVIGGGGGGGGSDGYGDNRSGGGGGSGGFLYQQFSASPGQQLTVKVGAGGTAAMWTFNDRPYCVGGTTGTKNAGDGYGSGVSGPNGFVIAWYGQGGHGNTSDNNDGWSGAGGNPNGRAGDPILNIRNDYCPTSGGNNLSGYGRGGNSNGWTGCSGYGSVICPQNGQDGSVTLYWTESAPPTVQLYFSFIEKIKYLLDKIRS